MAGIPGTEIAGWAGDGEVLCRGCVTHTWIAANDAEPIFVCTDDAANLSCDECGEVLLDTF